MSHLIFGMHDKPNAFHMGIDWAKKVRDLPKFSAFGTVTLIRAFSGSNEIENVPQDIGYQQISCYSQCFSYLTL